MMKIQAVLKPRKTRKTLIVYDPDRDQSMDSLVNEEVKVTCGEGVVTLGISN